MDYLSLEVVANSKIGLKALPGYTEARKPKK
jgi:hypothetical protein